MTRRAPVHGFEADAVSRSWRRRILFMQRARVVARFKRRIRRRERHQARVALDRGDQP